MRLAHLSDTHLGFSEFDAEDRETGANVRELDACRSFERACALIREAKPDLLIHTGDLFDSPRPPNRAIATAVREFARLARAGIPVVVIAGNHSQPTLRGTISPVEILAGLEGVTAIVAAPAVLRIGDALVHCIPHARDETELRKAVEAAVPDSERPHNVLAVHAGLLPGDRQWSEARIPRDLVLRKAREFDYVALGHYHRPTRVAPMAWYAGSTERFHPDESDCVKGLLLADLAERTVRHVAVPTRPFVEPDAIDCTGLSAAQIAGRIAALARQAPAGAVLRLKIEGVAKARLDELDLRTVRRSLPALLHLDVEVRHSADRREATGSWSPDPLPLQFERFVTDRVEEPSLRGSIVSSSRGYFARAREEPDT